VFLISWAPAGEREDRWRVLEADDLAPAKLGRNSQRDREDVFCLANTVPLDVTVLRQRYQNELRPYLGNPARKDFTLDLWVEAIGERRSRAAGSRVRSCVLLEHKT
jgi:hypothetical protein